MKTFSQMNAELGKTIKQKDEEKGRVGCKRVGRQRIDDQRRKKNEEEEENGEESN